MAELPYLTLLGVVGGVSTAAILGSLAAVLWAAEGASWTRRALAAWFAFTAAGRLASSVAPLYAPAEPFGAGVFYFMNHDFAILAGGALLAFLALYPRAPAPGSWPRRVAVGALALWALSVAAWFLCKPWLYVNWPGPGITGNVGFRLVRYEGITLLLTLMLFVALARSAREAPPVRRTAWMLLPLLGPPVIFAALNLLNAALLLVGAPFGNLPFFLDFWSTIPGDCCDLVLGLNAIATLAGLGLVAWGWRSGHLAPVALLAAALVLGLVNNFLPRPNPFDVENLVPVVLLYAATRLGAFDLRLPDRVWDVLGFLLGVHTFFLVTVIGNSDFQDPASLALTTGVGLVLSLAAVQTALPRGRGPLALLGMTPAAPGAPPDADRAPRLAPGAVVLGKYRVLQPLGEGAYGATWLAEDTLAGRRVVLKALRAGADEDGALLREAKALAALQHPQVVTLYEVEQVGGQTLLVMEHAAGGSLAQRLDRGPLPEEQWRRVARDTLAALEAIHGAGLVHRDVKPSNVLLMADGGAKVADFGIAHLPGAEATLAGLRDGATVGTVRFMSPEQARGRATQRSDLFSAGATLYEALTGQPYLAPGPGETAAELQLRAAFAKPFPRDAPVPAELRAWFAKALHPEPEKRFPTAAAMRAALTRALDGGR